MTNLNDTVEQSNIVSIVGSCEERRYAVSDLLCHTLRTHTVILQEQLDATDKPDIYRRVTVETTINASASSLLFHKRCIMYMSY